MKVLLIDDEELDRTNYSQKISQHVPGTDVIPASDSIAAWDSINKGLKPDLIIVDIWLPGPEHGIELISAFKKSPQLVNIPIFGLTTAHSDDTGLRAQRAGCDAFFRKRTDVLKLMDAIAELAANNIV